MAIDKSGKFWIGSNPQDLREYLLAFSEEGYPIGDFRLATCECGSSEFRVAADPNEGAARRTCAKCKKVRFICDSGEYWEEAEPEKWKCLCKSNTANVGVGFALREGKQDIKWLYVGIRCAKCGMFGCFADWKIDYSPSLQLTEQV